MVIWGLLLFFGLIVWFGTDLPDIEEIAKMPRQPNITIVDEKGNVLGNYGDFYGQPVRCDELPKHVINALLATEDRRFYYHFGIDPLGLFRALLRNVEAGGVVQGGSTITQQLAKNFLQSKKLYGPYDRSFKRKISEALLSFLIERRFTKEQILTMYLNRVYMGAGTYGIDAAALRYFGQHAIELGLYESAILIGLLRAPSRYSPAHNPERSEGRAKQVLLSMVDSGFISKEAAEAAMAMPTPLDEGLHRTSARYFTDWIIDSLPELVDVLQEDLEVVTTLSLPVQKIAERQARLVMAQRGVECRAEQVALLAMRPDGAIQAMIGGLSYRHSKFNRATQALRQPGSAFKFFVYLSALENGYTPDASISDRSFEIGGWEAGNFKYKSHGRTTVREGFVHSINSVAARLAAYVGLKRLIRMVRRLGVTSPLSNNYTISLGSSGLTLLEITGAFATIANKGYLATPYGVLLIRNRAGQVLYRHPQLDPNTEPVLDDEIVTEMKDMMEAVVERGTGRSAALSNRTAFGKTGTSQRYRDYWFIGMTSDLVTGVWTGCDTEKSMQYVKGGSPATHLWKAFNQKILFYRTNPHLKEWTLEDEDLPPLLKDGTYEKSHLPVHNIEDDTEDEDDEEEGDEDEEEEPKRQNRQVESSTPVKIDNAIDQAILENAEEESSPDQD